MSRPTLVPMRPAILLPLLATLACPRAIAQNDIENVIVETYYVSDANDAVETDGGILPEGSKTYRIFLDLCDSCALRGIFGSGDHPLDISSTAPFYNNLDRGKTFGHQINNSALDENTVALDSWLSLGGASNTRFGILKAEDPDTSSEELFPNDAGMLANDDPLAGIPLTQADGLVQDTSASVVPPTFFVEGSISPDSAFSDSTQASSFVSDSTFITCTHPGMRGPGDGNRVLIAQLTTAGELTFCINVEIEKPDGSLVRYVSSDTLLGEDETPNGLLCYPPVCGCTDPDFLEYDPTAGCDNGSCATAIVFGCLDTTACNYDPEANFNLSALCCYGPDSCNGLDAQILCPGVGIDDHDSGAFGITVFPNPVRDLLYVRIDGTARAEGVLYLLTGSGQLVQEQRFNNPGTNTRAVLDVADLSRGIYLVRVLVNGEHHVRVVVKN